MGKNFVLRDFIGDVFYQIRANRWKTVLLAFVGIVGIVLGMVFFVSVSKQNVQPSFAYKCFYGSFFSVLLCFTWEALLTFVGILLGSLWRWSTFLIFVTLFAYCLNFGVNVYALVYYFSFWGIICVCLIMLTDLFFTFCACSYSLHLTAETKSLSEAISQLQPCIILLVASIVLRLVILFLILRL